MSEETCEVRFFSRVVMVNEHWSLINFFCLKLKFAARVNRAICFNKYAFEQSTHLKTYSNNYLKL